MASETCACGKYFICNVIIGRINLLKYYSAKDNINFNKILQHMYQASYSAP